jgi:pimeloyl-ACP methyl ester carboxylesterase
VGAVFEVKKETVMRRLWVALLLLTAPGWTQNAKNSRKEEVPKVSFRVETGEIGGARFKIEIPENWNHGLVMYCHGYRDDAELPDEKDVQPIFDVLLKQGYAVAASGYSAAGWAVEQAVTDIETLRKYVGEKYGPPKETYIMGASMGGFLTMMLVEQFPATYDAGLALCGPLAPTPWFVERIALDRRVVFDYYFPQVLPSLDKVPADYRETDARIKEVLKLLNAHPSEALLLRRYSGIRSNADLAEAQVFATHMAMSLEQRSGGNPFDNRNTIYFDAGNDNAVNDGVKRYTADPGALAYLQKYYTPTGRLERPLLALHTTYDPVVPSWVPREYALLTRSAGKGDLFVQQYVKRDGHCSITPEEIGRGFTQLRTWKTTGVKPNAGWNH